MKFGVPAWSRSQGQIRCDTGWSENPCRSKYGRSSHWTWSDLRFFLKLNAAQTQGKKYKQTQNDSKRISTSLIEAFGTGEQVTVDGSQILFARTLLAAPRSRIASGGSRSTPVGIAAASTAPSEGDAHLRAAGTAAETRVVFLQIATFRSIYSEVKDDSTNLNSVQHSSRYEDTRWEPQD